MLVTRMVTPPPEEMNQFLIIVTPYIPQRSEQIIDSHCYCSGVPLFKYMMRLWRATVPPEVAREILQLDGVLDVTDMYGNSIL